MRLFSEPQTPPVPEQAHGHRSLALRALLDGLRPEARPLVLDLGPPLSGNVRFLAARSCRVRIADLYRSLGAEPLESRGAAGMPALLARLLPMAPGERFDAVLAWDVFDYLRIDQVKCLMERIRPRFDSAAQMLVFVSTRSRIPMEPSRYRIKDRENVDCERPKDDDGAAPLRPSPRYRQSDLVQMMPGLSVRHCYLMRNGIQEYLLAPPSLLPHR